MALIAQITSDHKLKLKGTVTTGQNKVAFDKDGNLFVNEIYTVEPAMDDAETIDDTYSLDDTTEFNDGVNDSSDVLEYLFDLTPTNTSINYFQIDGLNKIVLLNGVLESEIV